MYAPHPPLPRSRPGLPAIAAVLLLALPACEDSTGPSPRELGQIQLDSVLVVADGSTAQLGIRYVDRYGAPMEHLPDGLVLRWTSLDTTVATVRGGRVKGMHAGETEIRAQAGALAAAARVHVQPVAPTLVVLGGQDQASGRGELLNRTLDVLVLDVHGRPLPDAEVEFIATVGGGTLAPAVQRSDSLGRAAATWTLGDLRGTQRAEARVRGQASASAVFTARTMHQIAFMMMRDGNSEIFRMNEDGTRQRNLTNHPASDASPEWSPDGTKILFASNRDGQSELYVMNADGSGQTRLTYGGGVYGENHRWSPDGSRILFVSAHEGNHEIYVMNADGSNLHNLTNDPLYDSEPAWSPDGSRIAFLRIGGPTDYYPSWGRHVLMVMNADGSQPVELSASGGNRYAHPGWTPDGLTITYESAFRMMPPRILAINADGTGVRVLISLSLMDGGSLDPVWSPDGRMLAYIRHHPWSQHGPTSDASPRIRLANPDGTYRPLYTRDDARPPTFQESSPSWSPDSKKIAFVRFGLHLVTGIYTVSADGTSDETRLTSPQGHGYSPAWRP